MSGHNNLESRLPQVVIGLPGARRVVAQTCFVPLPDQQWSGSVTFTVVP